MRKYGNGVSLGFLGLVPWLNPFLKLFLNSFLNSFIGKFTILGITWSFLFQILSEIRHLIMDLGYGFEIQTTKITGLIVIFGSIIFTVIFYLIGKNFIL